MIILIPCKGLDQGKSRLSVALDEHAGHALYEFFLCQTLSTARVLVASENIYVVSADPKVDEIANRYGASILADSGLDLNLALDEARAAIAHATLVWRGC